MGNWSVGVCVQDNRGYEPKFADCGGVKVVLTESNLRL